MIIATNQPPLAVDDVVTLGEETQALIDDDFESANAVILGISFDTVADQKKFATGEGFAYQLLSDGDKSVGGQYDTVRKPGEKYAEHGIPRRVTYLINPEGVIHKAYDGEAEGVDLKAHAQEVLNDIRSAG